MMYKMMKSFLFKTLRKVAFLFGMFSSVIVFIIVLIFAIYFLMWWWDI